VEGDTVDSDLYNGRKTVVNVSPTTTEKRSTVMSVSVCLSVRDHIFRTTRPIFTIFCMLPMAVAWSFSGGVVICSVLPVLWMTSHLLISQGCLTSPPSRTAVHTQPWAWLETVRISTSCRPRDARDYFSGA